MQILSPYEQWLDAIYTEAERALGCTRSDAQGVVDAQPFALAQCWARDDDAPATIAVILSK